MLIETIHAGNVKELTDLYIEMFPETNYQEELEMLESILVSTTSVCFLAKELTAYVGFIHLSLRSDYVEGSDVTPTAYIEAIFVKPAFRRKGIAETLLKRAEEWAIANNCYTLASDSEIQNAASLIFHRELEFKEVNRIVCFIKQIEK